jgi:hypothetical protein
MIQVAEWRHNKTPIPQQIQIMRQIIQFIVEDTQDANSVYYSVENNSTTSLIENEDELIVETKNEDTQNKGTYFFNVTNGKLSTDALPGITYSVTNYEDPCD